MTKINPAPAIRLRGVRQNNLKNFDLDVLLGRLTVITGLSGSGKSSLAFDTLFAEGQRRYIETFSPYARQFFDRMDKPQVDRIEGIPPAIAIEQRNAVRSTRSTVGTMTELCDYLKVLWPYLARLHCRNCGQPVRREPPQMVWETLRAGIGEGNAEVLITFDLPLSSKLPLKESLELIAKQGYQRLLAGDEVLRLDEALGHRALAPPCPALRIVQDRLAVTDSNRARFIEACEQAYHFGKGKLAIRPLSPGQPRSKSQYQNSTLFSQGFHCAACDLDYREPTPALFSFNHPLGACPACKGFGRIISIDYNLAIPDPSKSLAEGCIKPWQTGHGQESQADLMKFCKAREIPTKIPFEKLPKKIQDWVVAGDPDYGTDEEHEWPRAWYGIKGYFRWLESKSYKMHVRVLLSRYRAYTTCPDCHGQRFKPESLLYRVILPNKNPTPADPGVRPPAVAGQPHGATSWTLADLYALPVEQALALIEQFAPEKSSAGDPLAMALSEVRSRLQYLVEVGLGYLTLDRPMRTLSGGETERVNLTTCLGSRLCNTLFVLDEPSVGLHPRDTAKLVNILHKLRDTGNTVVVVEHEARIIRAADQVVDLGPGQGEEGGQVLFAGSFADLLRDPQSLTGRYLSGRLQIPIPNRRPVRSAAGLSSPPLAPDLATGLRLQEMPVPYQAADWHDDLATLRIAQATGHNLHDLELELPLSRFVCITGVSGSGKTTLAREILLPTLTRHLGQRSTQARKASDRLDQQENQGREQGLAETPSPSATVRSGCLLEGWEQLSQVVLVDQSPLGKTPRSNPVVYIGAFDHIRDLFAQTELARQRGLNGSAFSFNSGVGQCERCRGAGFEKIEMQFLSDVFIRCPDCNGRRYRQHILEVKLDGPGNDPSPTRRGRLRTSAGKPTIPASWSIADMLEATVDRAILFIADYAAVPAGRRALERLQLLQDVGLGYLRLGQPINTLSGGESQRLKLVSHLADSNLLRLADDNAGRGRPSFIGASRSNALLASIHSRSRRLPVDPQPAGTLFLFDEPTTGLHFDDVRVLLEVFQRLVDAGHSLVVIEHNLDVIKSADWVIDLGPDAGAQGGRIVVQGTPEEVAACAASHTGRFLSEILAETTSAVKDE